MTPQQTTAIQQALDALTILSNAQDKEVRPEIWHKAKGWEAIEALQLAKQSGAPGLNPLWVATHPDGLFEVAEQPAQQEQLPEPVRLSRIFSEAERIYAEKIYILWTDAIEEAMAKHPQPPAQPQPVREWVGLTAEDVAGCMLSVDDPIQWGGFGADCAQIVKQFVRAIEAKLREKNGGTQQAQPQPNEACKWTRPDSDHMPDTWEASCGAMWTFTEGGPKDNDMHFCPKCGKPTIESAHGITNGGAA